MRLQQALGTAQVRSLIDAIAREQLDVALGGSIQESAVSLPARPHDGSLTDALLSEPVLSGIREKAAEHAAAAVSRWKRAERAKQRVSKKLGTRRLTHSQRAFLEGRNEMVTSAPAPDRTTRGGLILESMLHPAALDTDVPEGADLEAAQPEVTQADDRVRDPYSLRLCEAAVAAIPPERRGWREAMALRGCSGTTLDALGGKR